MRLYATRNKNDDTLPVHCYKWDDPGKYKISFDGHNWEYTYSDELFAIIDAVLYAQRRNTYVVFNFDPIGCEWVRWLAQTS